MRIWDVSPGYLNLQSLLGEHRELHGIYSILTQGKQGYSRHPETLRWTDAIDALIYRHRQLVAEMQLRGYADRTPLVVRDFAPSWPKSFVTEPSEQIVLLRRKYSHAQKGRIHLPVNPQEIWAQHKYSVMARHPALCQKLGRAVGRERHGHSLRDLALELVLILRERPTQPRLANAIEHMWGYVRKDATKEERVAAEQNPNQMLLRIQALTLRTRQPYLLSSTALSELSIFF